MCDSPANNNNSKKRICCLDRYNGETSAQLLLLNNMTTALTSEQKISISGIIRRYKKLLRCILEKNSKLCSDEFCEGYVTIIVAALSTFYGGPSASNPTKIPGTPFLSISTFEGQVEEAINEYIRRASRNGGKEK